MRIESEMVRREMLQIRHSSLYAPRDFDISPYFQIVKPTLVENFDYKFVDWADLPAPPAAVPKPDVARNGQGMPGGALAALERRESLARAPSLNGLE
jgi:hypothetical protein